MAYMKYAPSNKLRVKSGWMWVCGYSNGWVSFIRSCWVNATFLKEKFILENGSKSKVELE